MIIIHKHSTKTQTTMKVNSNKGQHIHGWRQRRLLLHLAFLLFESSASLVGIYQTQRPGERATRQKQQLVWYYMFDTHRALNKDSNNIFYCFGGDLLFYCILQIWLQFHLVTGIENGSTRMRWGNETKKQRLRHMQKYCPFRASISRFLYAHKKSYKYCVQQVLLHTNIHIVSLYVSI